MFDLKEATDFQFTTEGVEFGATFDNRPPQGHLVEVFGVDGTKVASAQYNHNWESINAEINGEGVAVNYFDFVGKKDSMKKLAVYLATLAQY